MKKIPAIFCFLAMLFINSAFDGYAQNNGEVLGELYVAGDAMFSMNIPAGWEIVDFGFQYQIVRGPVDRDFAPNITFAVEEYSGSLTEFMDEILTGIAVIYADLKVEQRGRFRTNSGLRGETVTIQGRINNLVVRQRLYCFRSRDRASVINITGTTVPVHGERYDTVFDECLKTFSWTRQPRQDGSTGRN
jgi:hypothetical protein